MAKTTKPVSSISYNSPDFLRQTLDTLIICKVISYYEFIEHFPDTDDKKKHFHLYIVPNKSLDLASFGDYFIEKDPTNEKPLKCMPFRTSKYGDWYWYSIHDKDYLKAKQLTKNCFYSDKDIVSSDIDFHKVLVSENPLINFAHMSDDMLRNYICECVYNGISLQQVLASGLVPLVKTYSVILFYNALLPVSQPSFTIPSKDKLKERKTELIVQNALKNEIKEELPFKDELF